MRKFLAIVPAFTLILLVFASSGTAFAAGVGHHPTARVASIALAASCTGHGCNNLDPYAQNCDTGDATHRAAYVATSYAYNKNGWNFVIDNWYSPKCLANWNVTTFYTATIQYVSIKNTKGDSDCYPNLAGTHYCNPGAAYITVSPAWTNMVDGTVKVTACVTPAHPYSEICGPAA